jgi:hypothetical protein
VVSAMYGRIKNTLFCIYVHFFDGYHWVLLAELGVIR